MRLKKRVDHQVPFPEPLRNERDHRPFLAILAIIMLVSFIGVLNHLEQEAITGGAVQAISFVQSGKELHFEVNTGPIKSATIHFTEDTKNARIAFEEQDPMAQNVAGPIHSVVLVSSEKPISFSTMDLLLKIKEHDLLSKDIAVSDVQLYANGDPVTTTLTDKDQTHVYFTAKVTTLGDYAVGKKKQEEPVSPQGEQPSPPDVLAEEEEEEELLVKAEPSLVGKAAQEPDAKESVSFGQKLRAFFSNFFG